MIHDHIEERSSFSSIQKGKERMVDSYDLIEWANEFLRQAEQEKIKTRTASSKLSKFK